MDRFLQDWPIQKIIPSNPLFPDNLKNITDAPKELFFRGNLPKLSLALPKLSLALPKPSNKLFAVVGARLASNYGRETAFALTKELSVAGLTIVSGMALGIDTIAHQATLETVKTSPLPFCPTMAVLGTGLNEEVIYPQENLKLAKLILEQGGCLISEYPPDAKGALYTFPQRNRIIAALSLGLLVIEAKIKSGALITANFAKQYKKPIFAVPGSIYSQSSKGCHLLIKQGAKLTESASDILEVLGMKKDEAKQRLFATPQEQAVETVLSSGALHIDKIIELTKLPASEIASTITIMEVDNKVRNLGNNTYALSR
ncbi:MAG: DNA-processing protein DprA [Candidatus Pacebacteria bacterium]|nr:DNA-processing protein DprA [Candidatus Paceibacterota bacterium]